MVSVVEVVVTVNFDFMQFPSLRISSEAHAHAETDTNTTHNANNTFLKKTKNPRFPTVCKPFLLPYLTP